MHDEILLPTDGGLEYDEENDCYRTACEPGEQPPSSVVVNAVAAVAECDPLDLEPLRRALDPDAIDDLFARTPGGRTRDAGSVEFSLADHRVVLAADGDVEVHPHA
ncbi:hypothetical protein M0R89_17225 [Halorussus limi]|uniref:Halobacterial output domain-containing protein n=1 Tax=Halorussus limi TaxID=2938695 RepID=A0A8U0HU80_9EURY|nr:HalOD1 output domain-containing protein [Halorussus limi]UPV74266.1 hypothetical protein M0R89_17225 [Halorussus limi]